MVIPEHLYMPIRKIQDTILICPPVVSQWAAVGALDVGRAYCRQRLEAIAEVREQALADLATLSDRVTVPPATGAFYFLPRIRSDLDMMTLVERLIREYGVAVIPGSTFGIEEGCYIRVAYGALQKETAQEGLERLTRGLAEILGVGTRR